MAISSKTHILSFRYGLLIILAIVLLLIGKTLIYSRHPVPIAVEVGLLQPITQIKGYSWRIEDSFPAQAVSIDVPSYLTVHLPNKQTWRTSAWRIILSQKSGVLEEISIGTQADITIQQAVQEAKKIAYGFNLSPQSEVWKMIQELEQPQKRDRLVKEKNSISQYAYLNDSLIMTLVSGKSM